MRHDCQLKKSESHHNFVELLPIIFSVTWYVCENINNDYGEGKLSIQLPYCQNLEESVKEKKSLW